MKYCLSKIILLLVCCSMSFFSPISEAKKRCRPLLDKLYNIQALQRHGYNLKKGKKLRARENKARDKWWQCERSSSFKKTKKKKKKSKKSQKEKYQKKHKKQSKKMNKVSAPFSNSQEIEVRSKYPRKKLFLWLNYYQQPKGCHKPKDLATFVFCNEDKLLQQKKFEQDYKG